MDYKRNARYFSQTFARNMLILAIAGVIIAVAGGFVWWNIYLGFWDVLVEIAAIAGVILAVGAISQRPSEADLFQQIEEAKKRFREEAMESFGYPADAEHCTRLVWGFVPGNVGKAAKGGKKVTDRVEFALIWLKKGELAVRRQTCGLLAEETEVTDIRLSLKTLTTQLDREAGLLTLSTADDTLVLSVFEPDYQLEEFVDKLEHQKVRWT